MLPISLGAVSIYTFQDKVEIADRCGSVTFAYLLSSFVHEQWRAVDQDGEIIDVFLQSRRDGVAAKRFFRRILKAHRGEPRRIVTDKLRSYGVAHRELMPDVIHDTSQYAAVYNLFNLGRHLVSAINYRLLRQGAMLSWRQATVV